MSFGWTITDPRYQQQPWKSEKFGGYFTDIQRAARRSLPRRPDRDLCRLLGITLAQDRLEQDTNRSPTKLQPVVIDTPDQRPRPDIAQPEKSSIIDKLKTILVCGTWTTENCSQREKTVFCFTVYFAIIVVILLIIVLMLSSTLYRLSNTDESTSRDSNRLNAMVTTEETISSSKVAHPPSTTKSKTKYFTTKSTNRSSLLETNSSTNSSDSAASDIGDQSDATSSVREQQSVSTPTSSSNSLATSVFNESLKSPTTKLSKESTISPTPSTTVLDSLFPTLEPHTITCESSSCLAANKTISRIDFKKSPCEDFYEFACGRWAENRQAEKLDNKTKNIPNTLQEDLRLKLLLEIRDLLQKAYREDDSIATKVSRRLFQSCKESNQYGQTLPGSALKEVHEFVDTLGMTADGYILNTLDTLLRTAVTRFEVTPFFQMSTVVLMNVEGVKVHALKIEPTTDYMDHNKYKETIEAGQESFRYVEALSQILSSYISSFEPGNIGGARRKRQSDEDSSLGDDHSKIFNRVLRTYYIEANISKIQEEASTTSTAGIPVRTGQYSYSELKFNFPNINWDACTGQSHTFIVELVNTDYFQALDILWKTLDEDDLKLFVFMSVLAKRVWTYMQLPFRSSLANITTNGDTVYSDIDCVNVALNLAGEEIHSLYIGQYTQKVLNTRLKLTNVENKISNVFQKYLSSAPWIQADLDRAVSALARNLKMHFSPLRSNVRQTDGITGSSQTFVSLALELHQQKHGTDMGRLGKEATEIAMDWTSARLYYDAYLNTIGLPTGLAIYLTDGDPAFDFYGYIGMSIAEEFIKILTGTLPDGVPPQWWGTNSMLAFDDISQCFGNQLSTNQNQHYDLGNVMTSNGAFQITNQAFITASTNTERNIPGTSLTENMLFIINVAQLHCKLDDGSYSYSLTRERINNIMMNNANLKRMFSCPDSSPLVSHDTCSLFS